MTVVYMGVCSGEGIVCLYFCAQIMCILLPRSSIDDLMLNVPRVKTLYTFMSPSCIWLSVSVDMGERVRVYWLSG